MVHEVVAQHVEMAAFLWELRAMAAGSHHYALADLLELEERIEAHIDGLRVAGEPAWELSLSALGAREPGAFFAAAVAAIEARDYPGLAAVLDAMEEEPVPAAGIAGALAWVSPADAMAMVEPLTSGDHAPALLRLALGACAAHGRDPGPLLGNALYGRDIELRAVAYRAVGRLGRRDLADELPGGFGLEDPGARFWSAWAGALLGVRGAVEVLWSIAREKSPFAETAADCAARASAPGAARREIETLAAWPELERVALFAAAALGDPALLPWVLDRLDVAPLARIAAEAVSRMTGVPIEGTLRRAPPPGAEPAPGGDPRASLKMDPDTQLAWPQAIPCRALCAAHRLTPGIRVVYGQPLDDAVIDRVLRLGTQRRRAGAAFERSARAPGRPLFDVTARAARQLAALGAAS